MSGHSKWATTHRQKEAADAKKGAAFTKLANLITLAAKEGGADAENNFKLRLAVEKARSANMPKDNIERAIKRGAGQGGDGAALAEIVYEIFGPAGSVFIAEAITDNKNRTIAEIKNILNKNGGQLGGPNSVLWMFDRAGFIISDAPRPESTEELELALIDGGVQDIVKSDQEWEIRVQPDELQKTVQLLKAKNIAVKESGLAFAAKNEISVADPETQNKITNLFAALESCDDINNVSTNANW